MTRGHNPHDTNGPSRAQRAGDQNLPQGGREEVQEALIADIRARRDLGVERYGQPLMTHSNRNALRDALEEAVDLAVYLKQVEMEVNDLKAALRAVWDLASRQTRLHVAQPTGYQGALTDVMNIISRRIPHPTEWLYGSIRPADVIEPACFYCGGRDGRCGCSMTPDPQPFNQKRS